MRVRPLILPDESGAMFALARRLHRTDPMWVAPMEAYERRRLDPGAAFFRHAELVVLGAFDGDELIATLSVLKDKNFDRGEGAKGERVIWFGYFECPDDPEVAAALFDRAAEQARSWGGDCLRGPRNLTRWEYAGLTVEGFDRLPPMLQGQHPPYCAGLLEGCDFKKHHDLLAYEIGLYQDDGSERPIPDALLGKAEGCKIEGLVVRRARWRSMRGDLLAAHAVLNASYETVPDVSPMPQATFLAIGRAYLAFANTELLQIGMVKGQPAAFAVCLPEINEALRHANGHLRGIPAFLRGLRHVETAAFKLIGVLPQYRGTGVHAKMIVNVVHGARRAGYRRIDGSVIDERNKPMRGVVEGIGMTVYRRYRFYERAV